MTSASQSRSSQTGSFANATTADGRPQHHRPTGALSERTAALLERRGLDTELCTALGIETATAADGGDDWIAIPYRRGGLTVHHKYRRVIKRKDAVNFAMDKGAETFWWNIDVITDKTLADQPLVITEGEVDAIVAIQAWKGRVISVPNGAPERQCKSGYAYLADTLDMMRHVREIIIATDADAPGVALLNDLAIRLGKGRCRFAAYQDGCKDLNEVLHRHGAQGVIACLDNARWMDVPGLYRMSELPPVNEAEPHVSGIPGLGDHYRLRRGDFCVITGVPGSGKSTFVNDLACRMVEKHNWHVCFASFEQHPQLDHRRALRTWINRKPADGQSKGEIEIADDWIDDNFVFVVPGEDGAADLEWLIDKAAAAVTRYGSKLVVIDPWNELDHARPKDATLTEYVGWAIRELKKFARNWNVHLIVVAHPAKMPRDREGRIPVPSLYDISDSAHWANKPDVALVVHPDKDEHGGAYTSLRVIKSRYHDRIGTPGEAKLLFNKHCARFEAA